MSMRQQEPIEPPETGAAPQQLALGALPAIHQDAVTARFPEEAGMVAFSRRHACGCSEEDEIEHRD
jgi:hypothetical protein